MAKDFCSVGTEYPVSKRKQSYPFPRLSLIHWVVFALFLSAQSGFANQQKDSKKPLTDKPAGPAKNETNGLGTDAEPAKQEKAAAQRNENVWVSKLDNEALKAEGARLGSELTIVSQAAVERNYFAAEHGRAASESAAVIRVPKMKGWHGELFESHRNSVFNARTFFQVGPVMPSHLNQYGLRLGGPVAGIGSVSATFSQREVRGAVNGNVQVPLPSERTPLATDPAVRAIVSRFLAAYPAIPPNRPDIDLRALNINATQAINETDAGIQLDREIQSQRRLSLSYSMNRQFIDAFQLVAGRNPDTSIHSHQVRITYLHALSEMTEISFVAGFNRAASDLHSEPNAVGPRVRFGRALEDLGPDSQYPVQRAQNTFRLGAVGYHRTRGGKHEFTFGADLYRTQLNGIQSYNLRGMFQFTNNFGRSAIQNLLMGTPTQYEVSIGNMNRGFRNWQINSFFADQWKVTPHLQIYLGLRHSAETTPSEVNDLNVLPYGIDWNNFSPRVSIVWHGAENWTARAMYTISYGQILPVTYSQIRYNEPSAYIVVPNPDLVDPLKGINLSAARTSPYVLSPDMVSPYSHQYSLTMEHRLSNGMQIRLGYLGSRTFKLLNGYVQNRAIPMPDIPLITATVDARRPDPRYSSIKRILNGGIAYLDAAQASMDTPTRRGFAAGATYTFSKAIDEGSSYINIAANHDLELRSQSQYNSLKDKKSTSDFDAPHSLKVYFTWDLPRFRGSSGALSWLANGWQINGAIMVASGTPFYITVGSDAPGFGNVDGESGDRPNILDPSILGATVGNPDTSTQILRRDRFSYIAPGQERGNIGWNVFRKQGIQNCNAAVSRQWQWGGRRAYTLRFQAEAFNLTNHPQFDGPQYTLTSAAFGKITNTLNDGRVLQFGLRLSF